MDDHKMRGEEKKIYKIPKEKNSINIHLPAVICYAVHRRQACSPIVKLSGALTFDEEARSKTCSPQSLFCAVLSFSHL